MIIKKDIYNKLIKITKEEECGFIMGNLDNYVDIFYAKNKSKERDKFIIGLIDKIKFAFRMIWNFYFDYILYHVHTIKEIPSFSDIQYRAIGEKIIIIFNKNIYSYRIIGTDMEKDIEKVDYEIK